MVTQAYYDWRNAGSPYSVALPIATLVTHARNHNIPVLGVIGNTEHLQSNNPQDHTPYSYTAWPLPLPGYVVTACDLESGDWCWDFLARCRSGEFSWVKYINFFNKNYSVKNGWVGTDNSDYHFHASARTDRLNVVAIDPWAPKKPEIVVPEGNEKMKFIYASGRGWALVGGLQWIVVDTQEHANTVAKVFGDATVVSAAEYDYIQSLLDNN